MVDGQYFACIQMQVLTDGKLGMSETLLYSSLMTHTLQQTDNTLPSNL